MMRTTYNIIGIAAKEISSSNPVLRQIGYRRMMGAYTVLGGAGTAALGIATELTGTSLEDVEAYKRRRLAKSDTNTKLTNTLNVYNTQMNDLRTDSATANKEQLNESLNRIINE